ncbi:unnamed protein product [Cuscuta epithymum]|uniref:Uncharacterized protein n=1 Tax=Cuscuta epithymum TaxID=186058 RepID=A0AAV0FVN2_9ASTE|nr:unnamed protein product [Cuscuta epithymum]
MVQGEEKKLKLNQPIISVRRGVSAKKLETGAALRLNRSESTVRSPGVVPFVWEDSPGKPKSNQCCCSFDKAVRRLKSFNRDDDDDDEQQVIVSSSSRQYWGDHVVDTPLPKTTFVFFKGSDTSSACPPPVAPPTNFMIGLFLPPSTKTVSLTKQGVLQKPMNRAGKHRGRLQPSSFDALCYGSHRDLKKEKEEEADATDFPPKACGAVPPFCVTSSTFIMDPVPATTLEKTRVFPTSPSNKMHTYSPARSCIKRVNDDANVGWMAGLSKQKVEVIRKSRFAAGNGAGLDAMRSCKKLQKWLDDQSNSSSMQVQDSERSSITNRNSQMMTMTKTKEHEGHAAAAANSFTDEGTNKRKLPAAVRNVDTDNASSSFDLMQLTATSSHQGTAIKQEASRKPRQHSSDKDMMMNFVFPAAASPPLPPPLPESPTDSWLSRTLPLLSAKSAPSTPSRKTPF